MEKRISFRHKNPGVMPLNSVSKAMKKGIDANGKVSKESKILMQQLLDEFIQTINDEAQSVCRSQRLSCVRGSHIIQALENLNFEEYAKPLTVYNERFLEHRRREKESSLAKENADSSPSSSSGSNTVTDDGPCGEVSPDPFPAISDPVMIPQDQQPILAEMQAVQDSIISGKDDVYNGPYCSLDKHPSLSNPPSSVTIAVTPLKERDTETASNYERVILPAWTIPATVKSGIRISAINVPELVSFVDTSSILQKLQASVAQPRLIEGPYRTEENVGTDNAHMDNSIPKTDSNNGAGRLLTPPPQTLAPRRVAEEYYPSDFDALPDNFFEL